MRVNLFPSKSSGFVILFAVILVSIVLAISLSLFNITFKQIILSSLARDTQLSLFAANSALECARQADQYGSIDDRPFGYYAFSGDDAVYNLVAPGDDTPIACSGGSVVPTVLVDAEGGCPAGFSCWRFSTYFSGQKEFCSRVVVTKRKAMEGNTDLLASELLTTIVSTGYSNHLGSAECGDPTAINNRTAVQIFRDSYEY
ncbi:MAG: hypothetical protein U9M92_03420 [Patescibacteria group bacterium]|nr:hypothetical protein [Patescibacteria group bacterium]